MSKTSDLSAVLKHQIKNFGYSIKRDVIGEVITVSDGIALVTGIEDAMLGEILDFGNNLYGMILNLEEEVAGVAIMGATRGVREGLKVKRTNRIISVPVGDQMLGRVVNSLGQAEDNKGEISTKEMREIFKVASGVMTREAVSQPLETGIVAIDSMIPIGKGQRELIIGDRQTGKTALVIDTIINQKGKNVKCVYVAIGQKNSTIAQVVKKLERFGAMEYTTIVLASASDTSPLQYIAPYSGVTIAEEWMHKGEDVLIIYDDLSKHAVAYRTLSLLLRRPPGREAYPGDVFYLHSQLLERAAKLNKEYGGGSITALPVIETQAGDISAYIPTNVISITDGQIFVMSDLFNSGQRPAIDAGYSVSRVGAAAQTKAIKKVSAGLKLALAQFNEMQAFAQFGSDLDKETKRILEHGKKVLEMMKQPQYSPFDQADQAIMLLSIRERITNVIPANEIIRFKTEMIEHFKRIEKAKKLRDVLADKKDFEGNLYFDIKEELRAFAEKFTLTIDGYKASDYEGIPK